MCGFPEDIGKLSPRLLLSSGAHTFKTEKGLVLVVGVGFCMEPVMSDSGFSTFTIPARGSFATTAERLMRHRDMTLCQAETDLRLRVFKFCEMVT